MPISGQLGRAARTVIPPAVWHALRKRTVEGAGLLMVACGVLVLAALLSFDPTDASLNRAAPADGTANLLGPPGALLADLLLQTFGTAAFLIPALLGGWGLRLLAHKGLGRFRLRLLLAAMTVGIGTIALQFVPAGLAILLPGYHPGGSMGLLVLWHMGIGPSPGPSSGIDPVILVSLLSAMVALAYGAAIGLSAAEWMGGAVAGARAIAAAGRSGYGAAVSLGRSGYDAALAVGRTGYEAARQAAATRTAETMPVTRREPTLTVRPRDEADGAEPLPIPLRTLKTMPRTEAAPDPVASPAVVARLADTEGSAAADPEFKSPVTVGPAPRPIEPGRRTGAAPILAEGAGEDEPVYELPPVELLQLTAAAGRAAGLDEESLRTNAAQLESVLADFGVRGTIQAVHPGPVVTLYELEPAPGTKSSRVIGLADDIARSMSAISVRVAVVPGRNVIGIELPNGKREIVYLRELLASDAYDRSTAKLPLVLGKDIGGSPIIADLSRFPHLLVAGTTGSGKSVAVNAMILSLIYRLPPDRCRFIMIDPKMLELSVYEGIPHLLSPVVTDPKIAVVALKWTVREMENRYRAMSRLGVRNIEGYNARLREAREKGELLTRRVQTGFDPDTGKPLFEEQALSLVEFPYIVVIVDEMADLMLVAGKDIEAAIQRLAQMARAAGIHLIMATQRPSVDVITGTIKANFPTRISFQVTSKIDSRTILGEQGAEQLLGQGDMLYMAGGGRITRVHGPFVRDDEVEGVVKFLKTQGEPNYIDSVTEELDEDVGGGDADGAAGGASGDNLYDRAVALVCREGKASTSFVQRHLRIGYNSAARLIERMEREGVVSKANHVGKREVLARNIEDPEN